MKYLPGIGVDEVGRGAWAGPFVACAVFIADDDKRIRGVRDSKQLLPAAREKISGKLQQAHPYGIGTVSVVELDTMGMTRAQVLVFERAIDAFTQLSSSDLIRGSRNKIKMDSPAACGTPPRRWPIKSGMTTYIDGLPIKSHPEWTAIIHGDQKLYSIAAASIIAKVARDQIMRELHIQDGRYCFDQHKGYGTALHQQSLAEHGPSVHHRRLFEPIRKLYTSE